MSGDRDFPPITGVDGMTPQQLSYYSGLLIANQIQISTLYKTSVYFMLSKYGNQLTSVVQSIHNHIKLFKIVHTIFRAVQKEMFKMHEKRVCSLLSFLNSRTFNNLFYDLVD